MNKAKEYVLNVFIGCDETLNALTLGAPGETVSGRAARGRNDGKVVWTQLANTLDWLQPGHCATALANDTAGRHDEVDALAGPDLEGK
jgi:hypothetical protein